VCSCEANDDRQSNAAVQRWLASFQLSRASQENLTAPAKICSQAPEIGVEVREYPHINELPNARPDRIVARTQRASGAKEEPAAYERVVKL
jgi:hypothetical protein